MRDRATLYLKQLGGAAGGPAGLGHQLDISLLSLEKQLSEYLAAGATERAFDMVRGERVPAWGEQQSGTLTW